MTGDSTKLRGVLFVDDEPHVLESLRDALRPRRRMWRMAFAVGGEAGLDELDRADYDVVVSDMRMPAIDGAALLREVQRRHPQTVRIVLSGYADSEAVARATPYAHRFLAKPCDIADLTRVVERSCALSELMQRESLRRVAACDAQLPSAPGVYQRLVELVDDSDATVSDAGRLVEQDSGIAAKVLQLANSAFFGGTQSIANVGAAVRHLGLPTLRALALSAGAADTLRPAEAVPGFSIDRVQRHGAIVARVARRLLEESQTRDDAVAAALLHDVGLLVLAAHEPRYLAEAIAEAQQAGERLDAVEYRRRGLSHAEVGAHLLDLWGLPHEIVEAVAFHHRPERAHDLALDAVAVVAIADMLVGEHGGGALDCPHRQVDEALVDQLGVGDRLAAWRDIAGEELTAAS